MQRGGLAVHGRRRGALGASVGLIAGDVQGEDRRREHPAEAAPEVIGAGASRRERAVPAQLIFRDIGRREIVKGGGALCRDDGSLRLGALTQPLDEEPLRIGRVA